MVIQKNVSLLPYNSFHIDVNASEFVSVKSVDNLEEIIAGPGKEPFLVLGGGSNVLLTKDIDGLVLKIDLVGIDEVKEEPSHIYVRAGAGENWHEFVQYAIKRNWGGLENLSLIPGNVGAAPIQNIGAYGVELKDIFFELEAYDRKEKKVYAFGVNDCKFGYRDSIFKTAEKGRYIILNVTFRLNKIPVLKTSYGAIREELKKMGVQSPTIQDISQAVIKIRRSKLPDPAEIGNAGSFFKNPVVDQALFLSLSKKYPEIPAYPHEDKSVKLAAGWLIEQCGWKGYRKGDAGVHADQALVLVNYGKANGLEILQLSEKIQKSVHKKFDINLEREVNVF
ncbi:MAG TPA: UDP-N-acetylmuramate dehydrogenase [Puia sp.]|jgi:UDP-N-acetylmuramate dehydrogenase|nr:UDP-N-acetylmuramate dehydrogenase [Puia sp.]